MKELSWRERGQLWLRLGLRLVMLLLGLLLLTRFGGTLWDWFSPFLLSGVFAWVLSPLVRLCQKRLKLSRWLAALTVLLLVVALLGALLWSLGSGLGREIVSLAADWETTLAALEGVANSLGGQLSKWLELLPASAQELMEGLMTRFFAWLEGAIPQFLSWAMDRAREIAMALPSFAVAAIAFVMASYFLLTDLPRLKVLVADKLPEGPRTFLVIVKRAVSAGFGGYVRAEFLLSVGVFFILLLGFLLIRQPYALLLALGLAVLDFIPIIGSGTAMVPWAVIDLLTGDYRHALGIMAVWGLVALFRRLGEPKILGNQTGLSPLTSLISVYVGMKVANVWGMILGPVVCLVVRNVIRSGVLDDALSDVRLAWRDMAAILRGGGESREKSS